MTCSPACRRGRVARDSPAVGYNQLLSTNTVSLIAEHGTGLLASSRQQAKGLSGEEKQKMERKIEAFKRMLAVARTLPHRWSDYESLPRPRPPAGASMPRSSTAISARCCRCRSLSNSVRFARIKGYTAPLTPAELELMNLTGDGNGIDMVIMPPALRARVPTANFFQQQGYERNPVAQRTGVVAALIASIEDKMASAAKSQGARDMAAAF